MADELSETAVTESRRPAMAVCREWIARTAAITVIVVLGVGLAATYGALNEEREAGVTRTELLKELESDNDTLQRDNDQLRALLNKQSELLIKLSRGEKVTEEELRGATLIPRPSPTIIPRPGPLGPPGPAGPVAPPGATPRPTPTVVPTPRPIITVPPVVPIPTRSPSPLLCVPLLNTCL